MTIYRLQIELLSDTTFGRGDGVAGVVDAEVQHDEYGCPYLAGRTLKGLLREECVNLLYALDQANKATPWWESARRLFGEPGSTHESRALLHISDAKLASDLHSVLAHAVQSGMLSRQQVLDSLTNIRHQTAIDIKSEAPRQETLRALRVIIRQTTFHAQLAFEDILTTTEQTYDLALLSACVKALRLAGTGRNRGVGEIRVRLQDTVGNDVTDHYFDTFTKEVSS